MESKNKIIAMPIHGGLLSEHFGHAEKFVFYTLNADQIIGKKELTPPPHAPGVIPAWLKDQNASVVIVNGIGQSAVNIFNSHGISVLRGVEPKSDDHIIKQYIEAEIVDREIRCNHDGHKGCSHE